MLFKMKFYTALVSSLAAIALLSGCETPDKEIYSRQIKIVSVPSGAPIVVDGLKVGKAPISLGVESTEDGFFPRKTVITAIPQSDKLHTQVVSFPPFRPDDPEKSRIPEQITFDMTKGADAGGGVILGDLD